MPGLVRLPHQPIAPRHPPSAAAAAEAARDAPAAPANRLLAALVAGDPAWPLAGFEPVTLAPGAPLIVAGAALRHAHFIESGLVSVVRRTGARGRAEVWLVGRDGFLGLPAVFGVGRVRHDALALTPCRAWRLPVPALRRLFDARSAFRDLILRYAYARMAEAMQMAACHSSHALTPRVARWLLMADTRLGGLGRGGGEPLEITHATLAALLSVRRAGVTQALHVLEGEGAIRSARRRIAMRDRQRLAALSCGCEAAVARDYAQVLAEA